eukprot:TRINITY_DN26471_c0_g1_i1.p1 TRINITY_DN26471_c0_g1~~TRINITY_DN26471_c0_g1_i1.p1  ORF type:complete len:641 (+),score=198.29 TRINITY_DN26471_c0_g1_i1:91-1923(+)
MRQRRAPPGGLLHTDREEFYACDETGEPPDDDWDAAAEKVARERAEVAARVFEGFRCPTLDGLRVWHLLAAALAVGLVGGATHLLVSRLRAAHPDPVPRVPLRKPLFPPPEPLAAAVAALRGHGTAANASVLWSSVTCGPSGGEAAVYKAGLAVTVARVEGRDDLNGARGRVATGEPLGADGGLLEVTVMRPAARETLRLPVAALSPVLSRPDEGCRLDAVCIAPSQGLVMLRERVEILKDPLTYSRTILRLPWSPPVLELPSDDEGLREVDAVLAGPEVCVLALQAAAQGAKEGSKGADRVAPDSAGLDPSALLYDTLLPAALTLQRSLAPGGSCEQAQVIVLLAYPEVRGWGAQAGRMLLSRDSPAALHLAALPPAPIRRAHGPQEGPLLFSEPWGCADSARMGASECTTLEGAAYDQGCYSAAALIRYRSILWHNFELAADAGPPEPEPVTGRRWAVICAPSEGPSVLLHPSELAAIVREAGFQPQLWDPIRADEGASAAALHRAEVVIGARGAGLALGALWLRPHAALIEAVAPAVSRASFAAPWDPEPGGRRTQAAAAAFGLDLRSIPGQRVAPPSARRAREGYLVVKVDGPRLLAELRAVHALR